MALMHFFIAEYEPKERSVKSIRISINERHFKCWRYCNDKIKPYSNLTTTLIGYFLMSKHHQIIKGLNLPLYYQNLSGVCKLLLYDKRKGYSNKYFREIIYEVLAEFTK